MAASVICPSCQLPNIPERRTCKRCGVSLEGAAAVESSVPPPVAVVPAPVPVASTPPPTAQGPSDPSGVVSRGVRISAYLGCYVQPCNLQRYRNLSQAPCSHHVRTCPQWRHAVLDRPSLRRLAAAEETAIIAS